MNFVILVICALFAVPLFKRVWVFFRNKNCEEPIEGWTKATVIFISGIAALGFALGALKLYTEILWFEELGYTQVFWTILQTKAIIFFAVFVVSTWWLILITNQVEKIAKKTLEEERREILRYWKADIKIKAFKYVMVFASVLIGFVVAIIMSQSIWDILILYRNQTPVGIKDPIFLKEVSFYLFTCPLFWFILTWIISMALIGLVVLTVTGVYYSLYIQEKKRGYGALKDAFGEFSLFPKVRIWGILLAITALALGIEGGYLSPYGLMTHEGNLLTGFHYTEVNFLIYVHRIFGILMVGTAIWAMIRYALKKSQAAVWLATLCTLMVWAVFTQGVGRIYRSLVVKPTELQKETPYIKHHIEFTRNAYNLNGVEEREFPANENLSLETLKENQEILESARLWDWQALKATLKQLQEIRTYYEFGDVDVDRYFLGGRYRQLMITPREMDTAQLPSSANTWINRSFKYTHGYGVAAAYTNQATENGLPVLAIKDIPPKSSEPGLKITRPEIYFGELTNNHIYVNTGTEEFNYPSGDNNITSRYEGKAGIHLNSFVRKLAFAHRFDGLGVFLSQYLTPGGKIVFRREITERVKRIAPFLRLDSDPYLVIRPNGTLMWIIDAYTTSEYYPYSRHLGGINYIRNSVKVTVDPYHGTVIFYTFDEKDPILKTWKQALPGLFKPQSEMPKDILAHTRYPEDIFKIQSEIYATYHMTNPEVWYNKEGVWQTGKETYEDNIQDVSPYYVITKIPGESRNEFILMLPFTPAKKDNMISWLAGRSDGAHYGKLVVLKMPKDKFIFGTLQIESRIDQHKEISSQLTLWKQKGSDVIRGNLLVIPIGDSILYVEPIFLKAERAEIPELKQVVVAYGNKLEWGATLDEALQKVFGQGTVSETTNAPLTSSVPTGTTASEAIICLDQYFSLMGQGKPKEAGEKLEQLRKMLLRQSTQK